MPHPGSFFIIDPPAALDPSTDTTLAIMEESLARGHRVFFATLAGIRLGKTGPAIRAHRVSSFTSHGLPEPAPPEDLDLSALDFLHMRKDPPLDLAYLHATYILDRMPKHVVQINPPGALRAHCEKLIPLNFSDLAPETIVSCSPEELLAFVDRGKAVIKPLEDCSGHGVHLIENANAGARETLHRATEGGTQFIQAQRYLPEIIEGDKRVLLLGGEILGWIRRVPAAGDFRSNINAGGVCVPCELTSADRDICARLGPWLRREEIHLAGVDIVGTYVLEVNITSPSCLREINDLTGRRLERRIVDYLEEFRRKRRES